MILPNVLTLVPQDGGATTQPLYFMLPYEGSLSVLKGIHTIFNDLPELIMEIKADPAAVSPDPPVDTATMEARAESAAVRVMRALALETGLRFRMGLSDVHVEDEPSTEGNVFPEYGLADAVEWCLSMEPSPCRCLDFATPPHVCKAHKALASWNERTLDPHEIQLATVVNTARRMEHALQACITWMKKEQKFQGDAGACYQMDRALEAAEKGIEVWKGLGP